MESRHKEAAYAGDVAMLRQLLREDRLLLHRPHAGSSALPTDGPLHIAAALGHSDFVKEILAVRQELACVPNGEGLTALHLASSNGHLSVTKELLASTSATQLCLLRDKNGMMPAHAAAINGRVDVLRELLDASPESLRAQTGHGYSVLHLAVLSNNFEVVKFLVEKIDEDDDLLNLQDDKGNTVLHVAVAWKQLQSVKLLLRRRNVKVNDVNSRGATALDVLLDSPVDLHGDLLLGELIRSAGGGTAAEQGHQQPQQQTTIVQTNAAVVVNTNSSTRSNRINLIPRVRRKLFVHAKGDQTDEKYKNRPGTIMVVATLIATITFQAGLSPPGGFTQANDSSSAGSASPIVESPYAHTSNAQLTSNDNSGHAVLDTSLHAFLFFDMVGLFASLSIILLFLCCAPRGNKMVMTVLVWIMWVAVLSTALAFIAAASKIFDQNPLFVNTVRVWLMVFLVFVVCVYIRVFIMCLLRKAGWCRKKESAEGGGSHHPALDYKRRILVAVLVIFLLAILAVVITFLVKGIW